MATLYGIELQNLTKTHETIAADIYVEGKCVGSYENSAFTSNQEYPLFEDELKKKGGIQVLKQLFLLQCMELCADALLNKGADMALILSDSENFIVHSITIDTAEKIPSLIKQGKLDLKNPAVLFADLYTSWDYGIAHRIHLKDVTVLHEEIHVCVEGGTIKASISPDVDYPGIDVEYIPDGSESGSYNNPRILMEKPFDQDQISGYVWNNPDSEDYSIKVSF